MDFLNFNSNSSYIISATLSGVALVTATYLLFFKNKKSEDTWESHILPHGPLVELKPGKLWSVTGEYRPDRNMTIYRNKEGGLIIHSCVVLNEKTQKQLESLGTPMVLIVPNRMHRLDAAIYKQRYPGMLVVCPKESISEVTSMVSVDGTCEDILPKYGVECLQPSGVSGELIYEVDVGDGSGLIFCDLIFNMVLKGGVGGIFMRIFGSWSDGKQPKVSRIFKLFGIKNKTLLKSFFSTLAKRKDLSILCVTHGNPVTEGCSEKLQIVSNNI